MKPHLLALVPLLLAGCGADRTAGTGSQTGNSVMAGRILTEDSQPARKVDVVLKPASWTIGMSADEIRTVQADDQGRFRFEDVPPGLWRLESRYGPTAWARNVRLRADQDSTLPEAICRPTGTLVTEVHLNDTLRAGSLVVLGTDIVRSLNYPALEIHVTIQGLPAGTNWIVLRAADGTSIRQASVLIHPGRSDTLESPEFTGELTGPEEDGLEDPF